MRRLNINKLSNEISKEKNKELLLNLSKEINKQNLILKNLLNIKQKKRILFRRYKKYKLY